MLEISCPRGIVGSVHSAFFLSNLVQLVMSSTYSKNCQFIFYAPLINFVLSISQNLQFLQHTQKNCHFIFYAPSSMFTISSSGFSVSPLRFFRLKVQNTTLFYVRSTMRQIVTSKVHMGVPSNMQFCLAWSPLILFIIFCKKHQECLLFTIHTK